MSSPLNSKKYLKLFACCIAVRGARRAVLVDTQRRRHYFVPNDLVELLGPAQAVAVEEALHAYADSAPTLREYFTFLLDHELAFLTDEPERFPPLDLAFQAPEPITHAIIDADAASTHDYAALATQLSALRCKALQLRFNIPLSCAALAELLAAFDDSTLRSLEVYLPVPTPAPTPDELRQLAQRVPRLHQLYLTGAEANRVLRLRKTNLTVVQLEQVLVFPSCCGVVQPDYFTHNLSHVTEAAGRNSCLNQKIAVDARGYIRNCPSMAQAFGHTQATTLAEVAAQAEFRQIWQVTKDQVRGCQDCEFRLICPDCRAYLEDPTDALSKPLKCGYDPYTATWAAWSTHPLKQAALQHYGLAVPVAAVEAG